MEDTLHIRSFLKLVRDPSRTAYDVLPSGKTIGQCANEIANARYLHKKALKCEHAREARSRKRDISNLG